MKNKLIFWGILIALLSIVPLTMLDSVNFSIAFKFPSGIASLLQRLLGLTAFVLMFWQLMLGAYMERWINRFGGWVFNFHVANGIVIYTLALLHPLAFLLFRHYIGIAIDPIYVFLGFCLYCQTKLDFYYTLGRIAFWLLTIGVLAGFFRKATPFMRFNWRKFHVLNYIAFLIVGVHEYLLGTDYMTQPFFYFSLIAYLLVIYTIIRKLPNLFNTYKKWISS
jgi:DMSO/TMAO reductase YedYZ heme-binding membrane subunit